MNNDFIEKTASKLEGAGYLTRTDPIIPGVRGLLYAFSPSPVRMGFAKSEDHFLFVDWDNDLFSNLDSLLETYKNFSSFVNRKFHLPHSLRIHLPNLAVVAVSASEFPQNAIQYACSTPLTPWHGGETGMIFLFELETNNLYYRTPSRFRENGSILLWHSINVIKNGLLE